MFRLSCSLTLVAAALGARLGEKDLVLAEMSTPVMRSVYADAPLEEDEPFAIEACLADLARDATFTRKDCDFFPLGLEQTAHTMAVAVLDRQGGEMRGAISP